MKMNSKTPEYRPGSCNIGGAEVRRRRNYGIAGIVLSIAFYVFTYSMHAPKGVRALIFFPLSLGAIGWYQSRRKFCLAFGLSGVFNFGNLGEVSRVADPAQRSADRAEAMKMLARATLTAAVFALILTFVPA
jgi:hypothetical protein